MDIDGNDAQDQNLHIAEEESSKVSSVSPSYSLPKFEFDDSLQGHLRFDNLDNEAFLEITSQEDNHWIEEYSTRKNVWSEATSSESVEMLLKSVGQEEKVLEESNRHSRLVNVMDPKGTLESVVLGDDKIATESLTNELQKDSSDSKVESGNTGSSQNNENASDESKKDFNNDPDDNIKSKEDGVVSVNEETENGVGNVTPAEIPAEVMLNKDDKAGNTDINVVGAADSSKKAESKTDVLNDAVVATESSKVSPPDTEDQPRSPILGVSLLSDDNKQKAEMGSNSEETSQKPAPEVEQGTVSDNAEKGEHLNAGPSEQTGDADSACLLDPKESKTDTKSVELSQSGKDDVTKGTKEEKNFTFEVNTSSSQTLNSPMNPVSSVISQGNQLDPVISQPPDISATKAARKPRKKSVETENTKQTNNVKEKTPRRSRKAEKSSLLTAHVSPVSNPKPGGTAPISTSNLQSLNNSFTDTQQVQLRAQILVYGSVLSGAPPEEPHMIAAFGQSDAERKAWEATWHAYVERVRGHKAQPNNPGPTTPNTGVKPASAQSKLISAVSSPIINPIIPISSPVWNIPTPGDTSQPNAIPKSDLFGPYQTPGMQNFAGHGHGHGHGHNPMWLSPGPFSGQWVASSPVASFNARFSSLPITESVKLTTVKESGAPSLPMIPAGPSVRPIVSPAGQTSGQTSSDPKSRKRKKVVSNVATSAVLSTPVPIFPNLVSTIAHGQGQPSLVAHVDQKIVTRENTLSKIEESKVQAADAALHADEAVKHCQNVWSQLESQKSSGLVSDDEAKLAASAVSIAAASSIAKVAAAAAKIALNVAEQARLTADEVFLSNKTETYDQITSTSIISAAKEAARRRIEAASAASKHAENLDAIVKAAELAAEAVSQAGKIVSLGNPLSLKELVEAGPEGYWKSPHSSQQGRGDKQNVETALKDKENSDVDQSMPQSTPDTLNDNIIKEGCLVEVRKDNDKKKNAWFTANVTTLKDGKAFVCYTELQSDDGKLKEWVPLEGDEPPRIRIAHPITTIQPEGTKKRGRTNLAEYAWCSGDHVDVWVQDCWCEAVIKEVNKIDLTSLTVQFSAQGETSVVRSWHVRPTLIWEDGKWIEWSSLKGSRSSEGDTPHGKRHKTGGNPVVEGKESRIIPISSQGISIDIGKIERIENKPDAFKTNKSGLQKKQSRVVFGVPQPGKTQKFMDVSTHRVDDKTNNNNNNNNINNNNNNKPNDSVKPGNYSTPQVSGARGSKGNSKTDAKEKQVAEVKPKVNKPRKPPVPTLKSLTQNEKSKLKSKSKPTSHDAATSDENLSGQPNAMDFDFSNTEDAKERSTSKGTKVEDKSTSEMEPRRSVRRIQPTSRLLEGLQSQLTVSHPSPRSHKVTSKGSG